MDAWRPSAPSGPFSGREVRPEDRIERGSSRGQRRRLLASFGPVLLVAIGLGVAACAASADEPTSRASPAASTLPVTSIDRPAAVPGPTSDTSAPTSASGAEVEASPDPTTTAAAVEPSSSATSSTVQDTTEPAPASTAADPVEATGPAIVLRLDLDRRVDDAATEGFAAFVRSVLTDDRGWSRAGFQFAFDGAGADYTVVLAEGDAVDALCLPYDTFGRFSCQIGPVVALNADRWRSGVDSWPASLDEYRTMLVNHEVGHLLGQHHPASRCPSNGLPAPVMAQQSSGVAPCTANPWPLAWEIDCAAQGVEPLAPPYERNITLTCGPDGPVG